MAQNQENKQDTDEVMVFAFCIASIALFGFLFWYRFHGTISMLFLMERNLLNYPFFLMYGAYVDITGQTSAVANQLLYSTTNLCQPSSLYNPFTTCMRDPNSISFVELSKSAIPYNMVFCGLALLIAFRSHLRVTEIHPVKRFQKIHNLDSFMNEQKINEPHLRLVTDFNAQDVSQNKGALMGMKTTREFALEHKLVIAATQREIIILEKGVTQSQKDSQEKVPVIDQNKLIKILRKQLGALWVGVDHITPAQTILLAMYLPRACSTDKSVSDADFSKIFKSCTQLEEEFWSIAVQDILHSEKFKPDGFDDEGLPFYPEGKKDLSVFEIDKLKKKFIEPYINTPVAKELLSKHAYTNTFIVAVVFCARRLGVMAPCQMRWLRFYDREVWALLQNIGRPSFFCENMGAISHYQAEFVAKQKIYQPHLDVAIKGFEYQLKTYFYSDEDLIKLGVPVDKINLKEEVNEP